MTTQAISIAVRYKSSPRGLAKQLVSPAPDEFRRLVKVGKNGVAYEQTGLTKLQVSRGVLAAAKLVVDKAPHATWEDLEAAIARNMKKTCGGNCLETFSARQSAADCCRLTGFVHNLARGRKPKRSGREERFLLC